MYTIEVSNKQSHIPVDSRWIEEIVRTTLQAEEVSSAEIDIAILDDDAIHRVNAEHLEHDYPTDVISFLYSCSPEQEEDFPEDQLRGTGLNLEGELLVSAQTAARMAREVNWPAAAELTLYLVHGLLHLCGYDDLTDEEQVIMRSRERAILQNWNLTPHYQS